MNDLELIKRCAEKSGLELHEPQDRPYNPLTDDAQAMALVKRFKPHMNCSAEGSWWVLLSHSEARGTDLNRAIVECTARMP